MGRPSVALATHRNEVLACLERHGVCRAVIFGSTARGQDRMTSDLDIGVRFVEFPAGNRYYGEGATQPDPLRYFGALGDLEEELAMIIGVSVDLVDIDHPGADQVVTDVLPLLPA